MTDQLFKTMSQSFKNKMKEKMVDQKEVNYDENPIGEGRYGAIYRGKLTHGGKVHEIAIKTMHDFSNEESFIEEVCSGFGLRPHPNVLPFLGLYYPAPHKRRDPLLSPMFKKPFIVSPFIKHGDLKNYLSDLNRSADITCKKLLFYLTDVAKGIQFLHHNQIIHRDIAARNCLLTESDRIKICDFGLCHKGSPYDNYCLKVNDKLCYSPEPWMAIESLKHSDWYDASDVWSFGVLVWEFFTRARRLPYGVKNNYSELLERGKRLGRPKTMPWAVYFFCLRCWDLTRDQRPKSEQLIKALGDFSARSQLFGIKKEVLEGMIDDDPEVEGLCDISYHEQLDRDV